MEMIDTMTTPAFLVVLAVIATLIVVGLYIVVRVWGGRQTGDTVTRPRRGPKERQRGRAVRRDRR